MCIHLTQISKLRSVLRVCVARRGMQNAWLIIPSHIIARRQKIACMLARLLIERIRFIWTHLDKWKAPWSPGARRPRPSPPHNGSPSPAPPPPPPPILDPTPYPPPSLFPRIMAITRRAGWPKTKEIKTHLKPSELEVVKSVFDEAGAKMICATSRVFLSIWQIFF